MKALCNKCINYEYDEVSARCILKMWPKVTLSKSKIYNAMMFECIDHERWPIPYSTYISCNSHPL